MKISATKLGKVFGEPPHEVVALKDVDLGVGQGGSFTVHHHFKKSGPRRRTISVTALDDEGTASAPQTFSIQVHK